MLHRSTHLLHPLDVFRVLFLNAPRAEKLPVPLCLSLFLSQSVSVRYTRSMFPEPGINKKVRTYHIYIYIYVSCTHPCAYQRGEILRQLLLCTDELLGEVRSTAEVDKQQPLLIANLSDSHLWDITGAAFKLCWVNQLCNFVQLIEFSEAAMD